jgi:large subunit ribosomal protein L23
MKKSPYSVVLDRRVTEKTSVLAGLVNAENNPSIRACQQAKAVFMVDPRSNKAEIAEAVEEIYRDKGVKVAKVNTIIRKPKKRRVRGRVGYRSGFKKAVVTFAKGDRIDEV